MPAETAGLLLTLSGELGAGKTSLTRAFLRALGHSGPVPSPTYTLVEPYHIENKDVYHVDLYRLGAQEELEFLGWSDMRASLVVVEWPERAVGLGDSADLAIVLAYRDEGREATLQARGRVGEAWLERLLADGLGVKPS